MKPLSLDPISLVSENVTWADKIMALSTAGAAIFTLGLLILAACAWKTAKDTLDASTNASDAAKASAEAARLANEQAKQDSIAQTRPYVDAEIVPGLAGIGAWDLKIRNTGKSPARGLLLDLNEWPQDSEEIVSSVKSMFSTPRTVLPGTSLRLMWRLEGNFTDGTSEAGLPRAGTISLHYGSDDEAKPTYTDKFSFDVTTAGHWPVGESGPEPDGLNDPARKFYLLGQALVRRISELTR